MKRSVQEVVELVVFALIALLVGTGLVWLVGWLLGLAGTLLTWLAGLVWSLLRFLVPIALVAGGVYLLVRLMNRSAEKVAREPQEQPMTPPSPWSRSQEASTEQQASADDAGAASAAESAAATTSEEETHGSTDHATSEVAERIEDDAEPSDDAARRSQDAVSHGDEHADEHGSEDEDEDDTPKDGGAAG